MSGYILLFTTQAVFKCEKLLKSAGIRTKLTPTPREFSSDCGIALYFWGAQQAQIDTLLLAHDLEYELHEYRDESLES